MCPSLAALVGAPLPGLGQRGGPPGEVGGRVLGDDHLVGGDQAQHVVARGGVGDVAADVDVGLGRDGDAAVDRRGARRPSVALHESVLVLPSDTITDCSKYMAPLAGTLTVCGAADRARAGGRRRTVAVIFHTRARPSARNWTIQALAVGSFQAVPPAVAASLMSRRDWVKWLKSIGVGNLSRKDGVVVRVVGAALEHRGRRGRAGAVEVVARAGPVLGVDRAPSRRPGG